MNRILRYCLTRMLRAISRLSFIMPLREKQILFYSFYGKQYSDSPKYISDYILAHNQDYNFTMYCGVKEPDKFKDFETQNLHFIKYKGLRFAFEHMRSKFIITNTTTFRLFARRKKQEMINTWHGGGAYKRDSFMLNSQSKIKSYYRKIYTVDVTLFLSSSKAFTEAFLYNVHHYKGNVLNVGLPRNDVILNTGLHEEIKKKVRQFFNFNSNIHIALYAPTWRGYDNGNSEKINFELLSDSLKKRFGGDWVLLYRAHDRTYTNDFQQVKNATIYPDMQELLITADVLITDYSSSIWDYSLLKKPAFLYVPDLKLYEERVGFVTPINKWGFAVCESNKELAKSIENYDSEKQLKAINENHELFQSYETGEASKRVFDYIVSRLDK